MSIARILVVEDDAIIARHIQNILKKYSYQVEGICTSGSQAVKFVRQNPPDLILMDISLEGDLDGIQTTEQIQAKRSLPVIFLTAFADPATLERAKITDPFGYVIKPFDERTLITNIEMALNKHNLEKRLRDSEERFRTLVENQGEGMAIVDPDERISFANPAFEDIFGIPRGQSKGRSLFDFTTDDYKRQIQDQTEIRRSGSRSVYEMEIIRPGGERRSLRVTATPWMKDSFFVGTFGVVLDITEQKRAQAAEHDQRVLAEALRDTAALLNSTLDPDEVLDRILENAGRVVPHDGANITLIEDGHIRIVRTRGKFGSSNLAPIIFNEQAVQTLLELFSPGKPILVSKADNFIVHNLDPHMNWLQSYAGAPIIIKGKITGFLNLGSYTSGYFKPEHIERLQAFADQAAIAIQNARYYEESRQRARFLDLLNQVTQTALNSTNIELTLNSIASLLHQVYHSDGIYLTLWDEERDQTIPAGAYGYSTEKPPPEVRLLASEALRKKKTIIIENITETPYFSDDQAKSFLLTSFLCFPLIAHDQDLGAIIIGNKNRYQFSKEEVGQGEEISAQVALAISRLRLLSEVKKLAITDDLTGLLNRRGIFESGYKLVQDSVHSGNPISMLWMDIDHFKEVNDRYGHPTGDEVIIVIADRCRNSVKGRDLVGRYGGEGGDELIVLMVDSDLEQAQSVAERLRIRIQDHPVNTRAGVISVTASLGVTTLRKGEDLSSLLNRADQAMYSAKNAGRNCVYIME